MSSISVVTCGNTDETPSRNSRPRSVVPWSKVRWVLLATAIFLRCAIVYIDGPLLGTDQGYQIAAARGLLEGRGVNLGVFSLSDISDVSTFALTWWPPLYSFIAAPLLALFGDPALVLAISVWAAIVLIFAAWFVILEALGSLVDGRAKLLLWLYWILLAPPIPQTGRTGATDYLALGFFSVALACAVVGLMKRSSRLKWGIAAGCALGLGGALRYAYVPLAAVLPVSLAAILFLSRDRRYIGYAVACAIPAAVIIGLAAIIQLTIQSASNPSVILMHTRSLFSVLNRLPPMPAIAFGLGSRWTADTPNTTLLWVISGFVILFLTVILITYFVQVLRSPTVERSAVNALTFLYLVAAMSCGILIATFTYLSLKQAPQSGWLFIEESRYYAPVFGLFNFIFFLSLFRKHLRSRLMAVATMVLLIFFAVMVTNNEVGIWAQRFHSGSRGVRMDAKNPNWQFYFRIKQLNDGGQAVHFLHSGVGNWYKAWASAAGAYIHGTIHRTKLLHPILTSRPVTIVALVMADSSETSRQLLLEFIQQGTITHKVSTDRDDLYVVEARR